DRPDCLMGGNRHEQTPQVLAIGQLGIAAPFGTSAEAVECAQCDIFFIRMTTQAVWQASLREMYQAVEIMFPKLLRSRLVSGLQFPNPDRDRRVGSHGPFVVHRPKHRLAKRMIIPWQSYKKARNL